MLKSLKEIIGYNIKASDGEIGKVSDFLFDDETWTIRYLVADTGNWLYDRLVLISPSSIGKPEWKSEELNVNLNKQQVQDSPKIEKDMPISRQHELELVKYYGWPDYWSGLGMGAGPAGTVPLQKVVPPQEVQAKEKEKENVDSHLRSTEEVINYNISTKDGYYGYVKDIIVDDEYWLLKNFVLGTRKILPGGRNILCDIDSINQIDFTRSLIDVDLSKEKIKNKPEFNHAELIEK
ncbi:MAG: PRC-barrel domain-containing protein [Ignavibacteriaceae bacterium]